MTFRFCQIPPLDHYCLQYATNQNKIKTASPAPLLGYAVRTGENTTETMDAIDSLNNLVAR